MSRVGFGKKLFVAAAMVALGASATVSKAATITFASFADTAANQWSYSNATGQLTATNASAIFVSLPPPDEILDYTGAATYTLTASAAGAATDVAGVVSQAINGTLTFKNGSITILQATFSGAIVRGNDGSISSGITADTTISGQFISYFSDPSVTVGSFTPPFSFSINLTQVPGITLGSGSNLSSFTATAGGTFSADESGASPTPLPVAAWGGMSLMGAIGGVGAFIKRRRR